MFNKFCYLFLFFLYSCASSIFAFESYIVDFKGVKSEEVLNAVKSISQLLYLQEIPPISKASLQRRAEADIPNIIKALHSFSFYNATVLLNIDFDQNPVSIVFEINVGASYSFGGFTLLQANKESKFPLSSLNPKELGLHIYQKALPKDILQAEETLLSLMEKAGYPFARIEKREVLVDQQKGQVFVNLTVDEGPFCLFGKVTIFGNESVSDAFIKKKLQWKENHIYNPERLERTENALEQTGLFNSITIEKGALQDERILPIQIHVEEAKQRSIGIGAGYATQRGIGGAFEWEHRNVRHMGEKLSLKTNIWRQLQEGTLTYVIPDFQKKRRDLRLMFDYEHERTRGYSQIFYSVSAILEKLVNEQIRISYGVMYKYLHDTRSDNNRGFNLLKIPFQLRFNNTNNLLDPTVGFSFNFKMIPSLQTFTPQFFYTINTLIGTFYLPLTDNHRLSFADKVTFGTIIGATHHAIPPSERFYAGSENLLRGYHYLTVSPLNHHNKPVGGRSMLINSWEIRFRKSETLGFCLFYEAGNVFESYLPDFSCRILQSCGVGFRYYTPVGPIRADLAFPLNRRKQLDGPFQFYMSIGQAF